ncbi:hypothetical protein GLOTRDRAFT_123030 [Gloeophyllum trabeum ATCC 11539]|uniref:AB hydrolase-1 domain-containing protein n=1 Tax=Gloeophyllum trabeum (strain ATCC 11539 / FP-39264 / Madison 617) TaxID=670483 RepID=S7RCD6_GLOTA|nr:uncharacterized protein GLOTRDRAFT_123030 [Gloeophyllum trabeum ATCC 11539]EPQ51885.1 hypothetical protein GLOTRDRAFT_123030 [Gloeophyllum trabeum ATCC 11539]
MVSTIAPTNTHTTMDDADAEQWEAEYEQSPCAPACAPPTDTSPYPNPPATPSTTFPSIPPPSAPFPERATHVVPAAWGRCTPAVPVPDLGGKGRRKERVREVAEELVGMKERWGRGEGGGGAGAGAGDERVLWLCVNRYAPARGEGRGVTLFFAHAIGFPKEIWEPTIARLLAHTRGRVDIAEIWCIESVQNGDSALLNDGNLGGLYDWQDHARDILAFLTAYLPASPSSTSSSLPTFLPRVPAPLSAHRAQHGYTSRTLVAIGHSFGGCTTALAATARPALFSALVLVDPVIIPHGCYPPRTVRGLVRGALARREGWRSRAEARRVLDRSPFFAAWDPEALGVYVECGLVAQEGAGAGVRLKTSGVQEAILFTDTRVPAETFERLAALPARVALHWVMPGRPAELGRREMGERCWRRRANAGNVVVERASHLVGVLVFFVLGAR